MGSSSARIVSLMATEQEMVERKCSGAESSKDSDDESVQSECSGPICAYSEMTKGLETDFDSEAVPVGGTISRTLRASVLIYDVAGLVVCFLWGTSTIRGYVILFGNTIFSDDNVLYALSLIVYVLATTFFLSVFIRIFFPSAGELSQAMGSKDEFVDEP